MKINFVSKNKKMVMGSYRIHVNDLNYYFQQANFPSSINDDGDVYILAKGISPKPYRNKICGLITPNAENVNDLKSADFCIVGSIEEKNSLIQHNPNVFIFPQIEKAYLNIKPKDHTHKKKLVIGFHGSPNHLNHLELGLTNALDRISLKHEIKLLIFRSQISSMRRWTVKKPNIPIEYVDFDLNTFSQNMYKFDIGIVPNISTFSCGDIGNSSSDDIDRDMWPTDIQIRFKNKSNIGRHLVLIQHGIPVVCDITPCSLSIFSNPNNGFAVLNEHGWYHALEQLTDHNERNRISQNAYKEYQRLYDPIYWATDLYNNIKKLYRK